LTHERAELAADNERLRAELAALLRATEAVSGRIERVMAELQEALEE
jgi:chaperonin cofactor prefoldin